MFISLAILTVVYMVQSAYMDIKEKKIYFLPCLILVFDWCMYMRYEDKWDIGMILAYLIFNLCIYFLLNKFHVWGEGDSAMLLLLSNVYIGVVGPMSGWQMIFGECMCLILTLIIAIGISYLESKVKKEKFGKTYKAAVAPGFAVVICVLLVIGVVVRYVL